MSEVLQPPRLSMSRLMLLGASSVVLCLSYLMAVFTPFPVAIATIMYGRVKGYAVALLGFSTCLVLSLTLMKGDFTGAGSYLMLSLIGLLIAEILRKDWAPVRSLLFAGLSLIAIVVASVGITLKTQKLDLHAVVSTEITRIQDQLKKAQTEGTLQQELDEIGLGQPADELATQTLKTFPGYFIMGIFFVLWVNSYLALKARRLLQPSFDHKHDERSLLDFKMPLWGVYFVVVGLVLVLVADKIPYGDFAGMTLLRMVGVFYFFQGFGIFLSVLNHYGILGFFRTLIVMMIVFFVPWLLALVGLFDTWFDFNNKLKKQVSN